MIRSMQVGHKLQIHCQACDASILFSVLDKEQCSAPIPCSNCGQKYAFGEETLRQLHLFEALCRQIHASREILGNTSIAIDMKDQHVEMPFNILLTRLTSVFDLKIGDESCPVAFRVEPLEDVSTAL